MKGLTLTERGKLVRDAGLAVIAAPVLFGSIISTIAIMEGLGL